MKLTFSHILKWMLGIRSFPIGVSAYFQGLSMLVSGEGTIPETNMGEIIQHICLIN